MQGYASPQPTDRFGQQVQPEQAGATPAVASVVSGALLSSMITLDGRATVVEVATGNGPAGIKWWGSVIGSANIHPSMSTSSFDNAVPANWIRRFTIPQSVTGVATAGSIVGGFGAMNGLYTNLTVMPLQATSPTSIFVTQYI